MKYKVGDKLRYDGGDWLLYGTVSAVFEHSICPCYRLNVERMEKKNCNFSITQFEFEIEADCEFESGKEERVWEKSEIEDLKRYYGNLNNEDISKALKRSPQTIEEKWRMIKQEPIEVHQEQEAEPEKEKQEKTPKQRKITDAWEKNLESYLKGEKSSVVNTWVSFNRKQYKTGKLADAKYEKLVKINFPFNTEKNKTDDWDKHLEEWKRGDRKSDHVQQWKQRSINQFVDGKLSEERIVKLREIGILK